MVNEDAQVRFNECKAEIDVIMTVADQVDSQEVGAMTLDFYSYGNRTLVSFGGVAAIFETDENLHCPCERLVAEIVVPALATICPQSLAFLYLATRGKLPSWWPAARM